MIDVAPKYVVKILVLVSTKTQAIERAGVFVRRGTDRRYGADVPHRGT